MATCVEGINKPIFIVSSGRLGSTILTLCVGQHPNVIPLKESDWLGPFAVDATVAFERGIAHGEHGQLSIGFEEWRHLSRRSRRTAQASYIERDIAIWWNSQKPPSNHCLIFLVNRTLGNVWSR